MSSTVPTPADTYRPPDLAACRAFAAPWLAAARAAGDIPQPGGPAWLALPGGDPRKLAALIRSGLARTAEDADLPRSLAEQIREADREADARVRGMSHDICGALTGTRVAR